MEKTPKKILLVEDEINLAKGLKFNLEREGYKVVLADNGQTALEYWGGEQFDMLILDLMLPKMGGIEVARKIREENIRFPILILSAKSADEDRALGLEVGADDYIAKPFHLPELLLRVKGILRRRDWYGEAETEKDIFHFSDMWINFVTGKAMGMRGEIQLTAREAQVMQLLVNRKEEPVSREELLQKVWGYISATETRTVDNFIVRLRKYFEKNPKKPKYILTVREKGYKFIRTFEKNV